MKISSKVLRSLTAILFLLLTAAGLLWHTGWGTLSSFGWKDIALICPLGAIEVMLAEKTFIPQAFFGLAAVFLICTIFGRIFCGWVCPVPLLKRLFRKRDEVRIDEQKTREAPGAPHEEKTEGSAAVPLACAQSSPANCAMEAEPACSACTSVRKAHAETEKSSRSSGARNAGPLAVLAGALASSAVFGFPVFCLICPVGLTFALLIALWRLFEVNDLSWSIAIFAGFLFLEIFVLRRWCGNFCPLGALMTLLSRSTAARSSEAIGTAPPATGQADSQRRSDGQTRPQISGSRPFSSIRSAASRTRSSRRSAIQAGMSGCCGQALTHAPHSMQRALCSRISESVRVPTAGRNVVRRFSSSSAAPVRRCDRGF